MKTTRKRHSAEFKAKVALEAIRGDLTPAAEGAAKAPITTAVWKSPAEISLDIGVDSGVSETRLAAGLI